MAWHDIANWQVRHLAPLNTTLHQYIKDDLDYLKSHVDDLEAAKVEQGDIDTTYQEVSATTGANQYDTEYVELTDVGEYGFYPATKAANGHAHLGVGGDNDSAYKTWFSVMAVEAVAGGVTGWAKVRYVKASRDYPVVWLRRVRQTGEVKAMVFAPECKGARHPFMTFDSDTEYIQAIEISRHYKLKKHLYRNIADRGVIWQVALGLLFDAIVIGKPAEPIKPIEEAPALYRPDVSVVDFVFRYME